MSRGFGTTYGVDGNDLIRSGYSGYALVRSYWVWGFRDSATEATGGGPRIIQQGQTGDLSGIRYDISNTALVLEFAAVFSTTNGAWQAAAGQVPTSGAWNGMGLSYDASSVSNNPIMYLNGTKITPSTITAPVGTHVVPTGFAIDVGNRDTTGARNWGGLLAHAAVWNGILSDAEFTALNAGALPSSIRPQALVTYLPLDGYLHPVWDRSPYRAFGSLSSGTKFWGVSPPKISAAPTWLNIKDTPGIFATPPTSFPLMGQAML